MQAGAIQVARQGHATAGFRFAARVACPAAPTLARRMNRLKRIAIGVGATTLVLLFLCAAAVLYALDGLGDGMCGNTVIAESLSPGGEWKAVSFERNCGATTGFSTQVSVLGAREELKNEGGNLLVATTAGGKAPAGPEGGPEVRIYWVSSSALELQYHFFAKTIRAEEKVRGVRAIHRRFSDAAR